MTLSSLPILDRGTVAKQIVDEGPLLRPSDQIAVNNGSTSGSSGVPVKFFASSMNARYNHVRSVAQYFLEERDLKLNRVQIDYAPHLQKEGLKVTRSEAWLGPLSCFFGCGSNKVIEYFRPDMKRFREELERDPIGYMVTAQWTVETLLQSIDLFRSEACWIAHVGLGGRCSRSRFARGVDASRRFGSFDLFSARDRPDRVRVRTYSWKLSRGHQ